MPQSGPSLLLINPWIYDFAAYDFFARPLGLLYLAGWLRARGYAVHFLDCLGAPHARTGPFGTGRYPKEIMPPPAALEGITRRYGRYGISEAAFRERLARVPTPAAILVTSLMTYWHPGVAAAIGLARERFPEAPVILGGIYASLCPEHAQKYSGAHRVVAGPGEAVIAGVLEEVAGVRRRGQISNGGFSVGRYLLQWCFDLTLGLSLAAFTAGASAICGTILDVLPFMLWITGIVSGHVSLSQIKRTGGYGRNRAIGGLVLNYFGLLFILIFTRGYYYSDYDRRASRVVGKSASANS